MVEATVLSASRQSCTAYSRDRVCLLRDFNVETSSEIRVERLLGAKGETRFPALRVDADAVLRVALRGVPWSITHDRPPPLDSEVRDVTQDTALADYFVGNRYLFSLHVVPPSGERVMGDVWLPTERTWIIDTLSAHRGQDCAEPIGEAVLGDRGR